jgi:UPF0716 protein FxsA
MSLRARLLVFGYPLLEVATAYVVALWIGWGWMLLLLLLGFPIGFAVMRNAGDAAARDIEEARRTGAEVDPGRHALTLVGGLLIMIPGFWSDLVGILLAIPLTQRLFRSRARAWFESRATFVRMPGVRYPGGDVVQGTVIYEENGPGTGSGNDEGGPSGPPTSPRSIDP